jgi:CTP:molybdopterin cytidylyltransferase MocA
VLVFCGRGRNRRELLKVHDPDGKYPSKVLLPMLGKRVIDWQLEALLASSYVNDVYLIGLEAEDYPFDDNIHHIPLETTSTFQEKVTAGWDTLSRIYPNLDHMVISTGDAPAITTRAIDLFFTALEQNRDADGLISAVPEEIMAKEFPENDKRFGKFIDQNLYFGEMAAIGKKGIPVLENELNQFTSWLRPFNRRADTAKSESTLLYLATHPRLLLLICKYFAFRPRLSKLIFKYLSGSLSLADGERILSKFLNLKIKVIIIPDASISLDLDMPEDYQKLSDYIQRTKILSV